MVWYDVGPPFVGKTASTLLARYSTSLAVFTGILHHFFFFGRALVMSDWLVGWEGLACKLCSNSSQRCSLLGWGQNSVQASEVLRRQSCLSMSLWTFTFCTGGRSCRNRKGSSTKCSHKVASMKLPKMSWYAEATVLSLELRGRAQLLKISSTP